MNPYAVLVVLLILAAIFAGIRKVTSKKAKPTKALGLSGQGLIKGVIELDMVKDGDFLKDSMTNQQITVTTSPILFVDSKNKHQFGYIVDLEKGTTVDLQKGGSVITLKTNPELVSNVIDSRIIQDAFGLRPYRGVIVAAFLVALAMGFLLGLAF